MGNKAPASANNYGAYKLLKEALAKGQPKKEYAEIEREEDEEFVKGNKKDPFVEGKKPKNVPKNRYVNILPNDDTRIMLQPQPLEPNENPTEEPDTLTYINANLIQVDKLKYIAAQAPLPHTFKDFWLMVHQQNVPIIVMLTKEIEQGQIKSHKYWPSEFQEKTYGYQTVDASESFGGTIKVSLYSEQEVEPSIIVRQLGLQNSKGDNKDKETRDVVLIQFTAWPDHGVPTEAAPILKLVEIVNTEMSNHPFSSPILVHCSAGIGRTGAFILIHSALFFMANSIPFNLKDMLKDIRTQRSGMVNSPQQFNFVYEALLQSLQEGPLKSSPRRHTN